MERTTTTVLLVFTILSYDLAILAGTAYLVANHDWSPWWFVLAVLLLMDPTADRYRRYYEEPKVEIKGVCDGVNLMDLKPINDSAGEDGEE